MTTIHCYRDYVFQIDYRPKQPAFVVDFPDIAEIITSGDTLADAFANACEALDLHLETLQKLGQPLPRAKHRMVLEGV
jgi:predicted RNase H-like HicB family nuclease